MGDEDAVFGSGTTTSGNSAFIDNQIFGGIDMMCTASVDLIDGFAPTAVGSGMATVNLPAPQILSLPALASARFLTGAYAVSIT